MGTVTVGFRSEPKKPDDVEARLKYLATDANSPLLNTLKTLLPSRELLIPNHKMHSY
jgi:hypothetical protein